MAWYAYSVLSRWFRSEYNRAGSEPFLDQMAKQVVVASSVTPKDVNYGLRSPETTYDIPDAVQPTDRNNPSRNSLFYYRQGI